MSKPKPPGALRRRVLTALFLLALVVGALFYLPSAWLAGFLGVFILVAAWEWAGLCGLSRPGERIPYVLVLAGAGTLALWASGHNTVYAIAIATVAVFWWLWALVDLVRHPQEPSGMFGTVAGKLLGGALVLLPAWLSAIYLHDTDPISPAAVLFVLVHPFPDMLGLLPLAVGFGYVYERTHSYLAVVSMHATFNAVTLAIALLP